MNREEISNALNGIDKKYIEEAADDLPVHRRPRSWAKRLIPLAACFAVVLSVGLYRTYLERGMKEEAGLAANTAPGETDAPFDDADRSEVTGECISTVVVKVQGNLIDGFTGAVLETEQADRCPVGAKVQVYVKGYDSEADSSEGMIIQENQEDNTEHLVRVQFSRSEAEPEHIVLYAENIEILD